MVNGLKSISRGPDAKKKKSVALKKPWEPNKKGGTSEKSRKHPGRQKQKS